MIKYVPKNRVPLERPLNTGSAWRGIESIIPSLIQDFNIDTARAIEFGIEAGYSLTALAHYFQEVIGVDTFAGDIYTHLHDPVETFKIVENNMKDWANVKLVVSDYRDYIKRDDSHYGLAHVDIVHSYDETYECGEWAVNHADVAIFHDTLSFHEVYNAVHNLSVKYDRDFYSFDESFGLGILVRKNRV